MNKLVILDAGHGINTPGKRSPLFGSPRVPVLEWQLNIAIVTALYKVLHLKGIAVEFSSTDIIDKSLKDRMATVNKIIKANNNSKILLVSIHCNAFGDGEQFTYPEGIEFLYSTKTIQNERLARHISACFDGVYLDAPNTYKNRGLRERNGLYLLNSSSVPTVMIEAGFMTCRMELERLLNYKFQVYLADKITEGILSYYGSLQA